MKPAPVLELTPGKRVLFLTKDPELIRRQLRGELDLGLDDLRLPADLLDDINTDVMTPRVWPPASASRKTREPGSPATAPRK